MQRDTEPLRRREILDLVARHEREPAADPARWHDALDVLHEDDDALDAALEVDPLLLFQRLPAADVDSQDAESMRRSVREMRRSREIESRIDRSRPAADRDRPAAALRSPVMRLAAIFATLLLAASFLLPLSDPVDPADTLSSGTASTQVAATTASAPAVPEPAPREAAELPLVENLEDGSELIQIEAPEMSIVVASLPSDFEI